MSDLDELTKAVSEKLNVSFDIFDTLIIRPYVAPTDLFRHLELLFKKDGF